MSIVLEKINKHVVKPIPIKSDGRLPKGWEICGADNLFYNATLISSTNSGKTTALMHLIKACVNKNTKITAFVSTFYNDPIWKVFRKWCKSKHIEFEGHTDIYEDGENLLLKKVNDLEEEAMIREEEEEDEEEEPAPPTLEDILKKANGIQEYMDAPEQEKKPKKSKYATPEQLFVFDDIGDLVKDPSFENLLKKARHFHIATITSIQTVKQCKPQTLEQVRMFMIFGGQKKENIYHIWNLLNMQISFDDFLALYKRAVEKSEKSKKPFFYFRPRENPPFFGRNFNEKYKWVQPENFV